MRKLKENGPGSLLTPEQRKLYSSYTILTRTRQNHLVTPEMRAAKNFYTKMQHMLTTGVTK